MKRISFFLFVALSCSIASNAQKVKYKDLIILLNAKEYEKAEPFLKKYLKDHTDNPSAYLFLGKIFQDKASKTDVLKNTELVIQHSDSALINFGIANKTIDEREVRRNDEYYQEYNRRDMRTGEFGVTLSDVKLDIEKRSQSLKDRKENVKKLKEHYVNAEKLYNRSVERFKEIKGNFSENKFLLTSDEKTIQQLKNFVALYDSAIISFESYKSISKLVGKTGYNQVISLVPIKSFLTDGLSAADFTKDDLKLWDYKGWSTKALETIEGDILDLRTQLVQTDININQLGEKLKKDSVSVKNELNEVVSKSLVTKLKKFDNDPLPLAIFELKVSELGYGSLILSHKKLKDSLNVYLQLSLVNEELSAAKKIDSLASSVNSRNIDGESSSYNDFINRSYGSTAVIKSLAVALKEFAAHEIELKQKQVEIKSKSLDWLIVGSDSIPLISDLSVKNRLHKMLVKKPDQFTVGLKFGADSLAVGYFHTITVSRIPDVSAVFSVDKVNFKKRAMPMIKSLAIDDGKAQIYFALIYSEEKIKEKYPVSVAKIYRSDGLAWSFNYFFDELPKGLIFSPDGSLSVTLVTEGKSIVIDKNGKIVK